MYNTLEFIISIINDSSKYSFNSKLGKDNIAEYVNLIDQKQYNDVFLFSTYIGLPNQTTTSDDIQYILDI